MAAANAPVYNPHKQKDIEIKEGKQHENQHQTKKQKAIENLQQGEN